MSDRNMIHPPVKDPHSFDALVRDAFLNKPRQVPHRPEASRTSTIVVRKEVVAFYYAIYDHDLERFTELQYRETPDSPLRSVALSPTMQPGT